MKKIAKIILITVAVIFGLLLAIGFLADDEETQVKSPSSVDGSNEMQKESGGEESVVEESGEEERSGGDETGRSEAYFKFGEKVTFELLQGGTVDITLNDWGEAWDYTHNLIWIDVTVENPGNEKLDVGISMLNLAAYGDNEALNESSYGDDRLEDARLDPGRSASGKIYFVCNDSDYSVIEAQINNAKWILKDADSELPSDIEADEEELDIYEEFYKEEE